MTDKELLQEALEALTYVGDKEIYSDTIDALRARLAQPDVTETNFGKMPETINMENFVGSGKPLVPVCWMNANDIDKTDWKVWAHGKPTVSMPLFTVPPKREWVGLTKEELAEIAEFHFHGALSGREFYDDVEAKLKEKNT